MLAARPGSRHSSSCPFADQVALELGDRAHDVEQQASAGGGCVDGFREVAESDGFRFEAGNNLHEVRETATQSVELPYDDYIARSERVQRGPLSSAIVMISALQHSLHRGRAG